MQVFHRCLEVGLGGFGFLRTSGQSDEEDLDESMAHQLMVDSLITSRRREGNSKMFKGM